MNRKEWLDLPGYVLFQLGDVSSHGVDDGINLRNHVIVSSISFW
jgi:hypothetical protein